MLVMLQDNVGLVLFDRVVFFLFTFCLFCMFSGKTQLMILMEKRAMRVK